MYALASVANDKCVLHVFVPRDVPIDSMQTETAKTNIFFTLTCTLYNCVYKISRSGILCV